MKHENLNDDMDIPRHLSPDINLFYQDWFLAQALKKTASYIRRHNWYADMLELDTATANIKEFFDEVRELIKDPNYTPKPCRVVPAPKNELWEVIDAKDEPKVWHSVGSEKRHLRPLAHICLHDQVIWTGIMMCLAEMTEQRFGDPSVQKYSNTEDYKTASYGNRLQCRWEGDEVRFSWGNADVYRKFFTDYQAFLHRSKDACRLGLDCTQPSEECYLMKTDIKSFYDHIDRKELLMRLKEMSGHEYLETDPFWVLTERALKWTWDEQSEGIQGLFSGGKLPINGIPQGLVAGGWLANVYLHTFDHEIAKQIQFGEDLPSSFSPLNYMRYVDDIFVVVKIDERSMESLQLMMGMHDDDPWDVVKSKIGGRVTDWLHGVMKKVGVKLFNGEMLIDKGDEIFEKDKTDLYLAKDILRQDETVVLMDRIQSQMSGPFDRGDADAVLMSAEALLAVVEKTASEGRWNAWSKKHGKHEAQPKNPEQIMFPKEYSSAQIKDTTIARFTANRVARVLKESSIWDSEPHFESKQQRHFFRAFISIFLTNPSLAVVFRKALELDADAKTVSVILELMKGVITGQGDGFPPYDKYVVWFLTADLLRASAREIGFTDDIPTEKAEAYREQIDQYVNWLDGNKDAQPCPWYVVQQILLYRCSRGQPWPYVSKHPHVELAKDYQLIFAWSRSTKLDMNDLTWKYLMTALDWFAPDQIEMTRIIACLDTHSDAVSLFTQLYYAHPQIAIRVEAITSNAPRKWIANHIHSELYTLKRMTGKVLGKHFVSLIHIVTASSNPFKHEASLLALAEALLESGVLDQDCDLRQIEVCSTEERGIDKGLLSKMEHNLQIQISETGSIVVDPRFQCPKWVPKNKKATYRLGMILRSSCLGQIDYTGHFVLPRQERRHADALHCYRGHRGTWERRQFGFFGDLIALVGETSTISSWTQDFLSILMAWPGSFFWGKPINDRWNWTVSHLLAHVKDRRKKLVDCYAQSLELPVLTEPVHLDLDNGPHMRVVVIQNVRPTSADFKKYKAELNDPQMRREHRSHIREVFGLTCKHLEASKTVDPKYKSHADLIILPEVAIHEDDLDLIEDLSRKTHACVLAGMVFRKGASGKLINQAVWYLRDMVKRDGSESIQNRFCFQGKGNMNKPERAMGIEPSRDVQIIIECHHQSFPEPVRITAAVCYDATDVRLAADLRNQTDMFIVPSFNPDVGNFDAMAASYRYQMFQHVAVVNSGEYGGTSVSSPQDENHRHQRILSHVHGGGHIAISLCDVNLTEYYQLAHPVQNAHLKEPPAGYGRHDWEPS